MIRRFAAIGVVLLLVAACGDDDDGDDRPAPIVDEIERAVNAVERELGEATEYFEIVATPLAVTVVVAADEGRRAVPYVWADGELTDPDAGQEASGFTFEAAEALAFDADGVTAAMDEVPAQSTLSQFSIVGTESGAPRFRLIAQSQRGGVMEIQLDASGDVLAVDAGD